MSKFEILHKFDNGRAMRARVLCRICFLLNYYIFHILTCGNDKSHRIDRWLQLVDISKLGLNSKIKKFSYSFICGKGYSPPFGGRIAFCLQSATFI